MTTGIKRYANGYETETLMPKLKNIVGNKFGELLVLECAGKDKNGKYLWLCSCTCGKRKIIRGNHLCSGASKSCGCKEAVKKTHGMTHTKEYNTWRGMIARCTYVKHPQFMDYGGRGIRVCKRWLSFSNFYADMGVRPRGMCLERIDNNGNYEPKNCKWISQPKQSRNRRGNRLITWGDKTRCMSEWAEIKGIKAMTLQRRLNLGWGVGKCLTTPIKKRKINDVPNTNATGDNHE